MLSAQDAAIERRDTLARQLAEARSRLERLDKETSAVSASNEAFARSLSELMTHVDGDICPVCDRDFSEVSHAPLSSHVAAKVATMIEQAGHLQALLQSRTNTQSEVSQVDREMQAAASGLISETEFYALKTRAADLTDVSAQLIDASAELAAGDRARADATRAARAIVSFDSADQTVVVLRKAIEELSRNTGVPFEASTTTEKLLEDLSAAIIERERLLTERQAARRSAIGAAQFLQIGRSDLALLQDTARDLKSSLAARKQQKADADAVIGVGKELANQTLEVRDSVVRRVFNDELNAVWRDLFVRLAPEEPFIPAFAMPESAKKVEAVLETQHRRGGKGGNPRAGRGDGARVSGGLSSPHQPYQGCDTFRQLLEGARCKLPDRCRPKRWR